LLCHSAACDIQIHFLMHLAQSTVSRLPSRCSALPRYALPCLALLCLALPCNALPCLALPCIALWLCDQPGPTPAQFPFRQTLHASMKGAPIE
jgi:hypothetical protein